MKTVGLSVYFFLVLLKFSSGQTINISGYVTDSLTGERLIGASVYTDNGRGTISNNNGFFNLVLPSDANDFYVSFVGYQTKNVKVPATNKKTLNIALSQGNEIEELDIFGENPNQISSYRNPGMKNIPLNITAKLPVIMGEQDIMKSLQLMPGVHPGSEGNTGLHVRGGGAGHNMILVDGVEVFNPNHLLGFFSVFNNDAINQVNFYTSGIPARYNGRLSSVTSIHMKDGHHKKISGKGTVGLISTKFLLEGPLIKDKLTFMISGRRTYLDLIAKPLIKRFIEKYDADYFFYDLNGKIKWQINEKSALYVSNYSGTDRGMISNSYTFGTFIPQQESIYLRNLEVKELQWGNRLFITHYEMSTENGLYFDISASHSKYNYKGININSDTVAYWPEEKLVVETSNYTVITKSNIDEYTLSINSEYNTPKHKIGIGGNIKYYKLLPGVENIQLTDAPNNTSLTQNHLIPFLYFQDQYKINDDLNINAGINISKLFAANQKTNADPRISINYEPIANLHSSVGYSSTTQYFHLLTMSKISLASDLWLMANENLSPSRAKDFTITLASNHIKMWNISISGYYRLYNDLLEYKEGASFANSTKSFENLVTKGKGNARGVELLIEKKYGKFKGFITYNFSDAKRKFRELNRGEVFKARYNRPHLLNIAGTVDIGNQWSVGMIFNLMSGARQTFSYNRYVSLYEFGESLTDDYGYHSSGNWDIFSYQRNGYQLPVYHRLDLSVSYRFKAFLTTNTITLGVYNAYNSKNAYDLQQIYTPLHNINDFESLNFYQTDEKVLFVMIPFLNLNFKF